MPRYVYPGDADSTSGSSEDELPGGPSRHPRWLDGIQHSISKRREREQAVCSIADVRLKPGQIRLIYFKHHLRSSTRSSRSPINCSRYIFDLENAPPYYTLSYTCAPPFRERHINDRECTLEEPTELLTESQSRICCDGRSIPVYTNLLHALQQLRHVLRRDMWLWVDCLCIRQDDLEETAAQVQQMHTIYSSAREVYVWLGPSLGLRHDVLEFIRDFCNVASKLLDPTTRQVQDQYKDTAILDTSWHSSLGIKDFEEKLIDLMIFLKLCRYPSRLWCLQEVVLARRASILGHGRNETFNCIPYLVDYFDKAGWFRWLDEALDQKNLYIPGEPWDALQGMRSVILRFFSEHSKTSFSRLRSASVASIAKKTQSYFDFAELLYYSRSLACSDPRDKIYGLLGLASRLGPPQTIDVGPVAYTISVGDLYTNVQQRILSETQCVDLLAFVGQSLQRSDPSLPSWVPDHRHMGPLESTMEVYLELEKGTPSPRPLLEAQSEQRDVWFDGRKLCCRGTHLDEVEHNYRLPEGGRDLPYDDWIPSHQATYDALLALTESGDDFSPFAILTQTALLGCQGDHTDMQLCFATYLILNHVYKGQPGDRSLTSTLERCTQISSTLTHWSLDTDLIPRVQSILDEVKDAITTCSTPYAFEEKFQQFQVTYDAAISRFVAAAKRVANSRVLVRTKRGWLASTQRPAEKGDQIFVLEGSRTMYVFRRTAAAGEYVLDGDCYICLDQVGLRERMAGLQECVEVMKIV